MMNCLMSYFAYDAPCCIVYTYTIVIYCGTRAVEKVPYRMEDFTINVDISISGFLLYSVTRIDILSSLPM